LSERHRPDRAVFDKLRKTQNPKLKTQNAREAG